MTLKTSQRGRIPPFMVMDVMKAASDLEAQGRSVIHLEVGQPETGLPKAAIAPVQRLIDQEALGYTVANGVVQLRQRIVDHYHTVHGVVIDPSSVFITTGSSAGFQLAFLSAFDVGDRVAVASPGYPAYRHILSSLGLEPVLLSVGAESRYQPTVSSLEALDKPVDGLILASPSNPTGTVIPAAEFEALVTYCRSAGIRLVSDEIYHGITYDVDVATAAGRDGPEIIINSFSKYFSMTGWRIGWLIVPPDLQRSVECLAQNHYISPPTISQWAAYHAFDGTDELERNVARYRINRDTLLQGLPDAGFGNLAPSDGAFYIYADVSDLTQDSVAFCKALLEQTGVAITPGVDFDPDHGHQTLRISFAGSTSDMEEAIRRLKSR